VRAQRLNALVLLELELQLHAAVAQREAAAVQRQLTAAGQQARALALEPLAAQVQRPEALAQRSDPYERRARGQLVAEHAHITPALERPRAVQKLRPSRRQGAGADQRGGRGRYA
jgi:hypothetical protein